MKAKKKIKARVKNFSRWGSQCYEVLAYYAEAWRIFGAPEIGAWSSKKAAKKGAEKVAAFFGVEIIWQEQIRNKSGNLVFRDVK